MATSLKICIQMKQKNYSLFVLIPPSLSPSPLSLPPSPPLHIPPSLSSPFFPYTLKLKRFIGVSTTITVEHLDRLAVDVLFVVGVDAAKHMYSNSDLFDSVGCPSDLITLQPYFKIISIV